MKLKLSFAWVTACLLLAGCAAPVELIKLDNEWARAYTGKLEAERTNPDKFLVATSFEPQLVDLSIRAEKAGDAIAASDPAMAVGFYRVAASSAWKSGSAREAQVLAISDKAGKACASLPKQDASQPRDCIFLKLVPQLALFDVKAREIKELVSAGPTIPPAKHARSLELVNEIGGSPDGIVARVLAGYRSVETVAPTLRGYLADNLTVEYCAIQNFFGSFIGSLPSPAQVDSMRTVVNGAKASLEAAQISTTCK